MQWMITLCQISSFLRPVAAGMVALMADSVAVTTTAKEKTTPNFSPSPHLIGQQPNFNASPPHFKDFSSTNCPLLFVFHHYYQLSPSSILSDVSQTQGQREGCCKPPCTPIQPTRYTLLT